MHVGRKTNLRVLNRADGAKACCGRVAAQRGLTGIDTSAFLFWVPAHMDLIMEGCQKVHPSISTYGLTWSTIQVKLKP